MIVIMCCEPKLQPSEIALLSSLHLIIVSGSVCISGAFLYKGGRIEHFMKQ